MTILRNNAEAFADGAANNTSTASPDAFTSVQMSGSGTCTIRTSSAIGGSRGFDSAGPTGSLSKSGWWITTDAHNAVAGSARFKGRAAPAADQRIININRTGGSTSCPYFIWRSTGNIELWTAAHALVTGWTATAAPTDPADVMELRLYAVKGTTTTDGTIIGEMYVNGALVESVNNAACNAGINTFGGVFFGRCTASTCTDSFIFDDAAAEMAGAGLITAVSDFTGTVAQTLPAVTQAAAGDSTPPAFSATVAQTLPAVTQAASGTTAVPAFTATVAQTLLAITQAATGAITQPGYTAAIAQTLPAVTQAVAGGVVPPNFAGVVTQALPALTQSAVGDLEAPAYVGVITQVLPPITQAADGVFVALDLDFTVVTGLTRLTTPVITMTLHPLLVLEGIDMKLSPHGKEIATVTVSNEPVGATFEITFDEGATWTAMVDIGGSRHTVKLAGPDIGPAPTDALVLALGVNEAEIRLTTAEEIIPRPAGSVEVYA